MKVGHSEGVQIDATRMCAMQTGHGANCIGLGIGLVATYKSGDKEVKGYHESGLGLEFHGICIRAGGQIGGTAGVAA